MKPHTVLDRHEHFGLHRWTGKCPIASVISVKQEHSYESYDSLNKVQKDSARQTGFFRWMEVVSL